MVKYLLESIETYLETKAKNDAKLEDPTKGWTYDRDYKDWIAETEQARYNVEQSLNDFIDSRVIDTLKEYNLFN